MPLDLDNLTPDEAAFRATLDAAGVPTTSDAMRAQWQAQTAASGITITNTSSVSPFWSLITSLVTTPALWLVAYLVRVLMPSTYVKTAAGNALDLLAWTYGVTRKSAAKATGELLFTRLDSAAVQEIPLGTVVRTITLAGTVYRVVTTQAAQFEIGETTKTVPVIAEAAGAGYNLGDGYYTILESYLPGAAVTVTNTDDWLATPGADVETDAALRARVRNQFLATGQWHTDAVYRAMISDYLAIDVDRIYFDHEIPRGPGSADAYILYDSAATPAQQLALINDFIASQGNHGHGDDLVVFAVPSENHDLIVKLYFIPAATDDDKTAAFAEAEQLIRCAFRENTDYLDQVTQVRPETRNSMSRLAAELHAALPAVQSVTINSADIVSGLTVPRLNSLTLQDGDLV